MSTLLLTCLLLAASPVEVRDGFDRRVAEAFEAQRGQPFEPARIREPLGANRGVYSRGYSWSVVDFAARCFRFNEQIAQANAALIENVHLYLDEPKNLLDRDSFHWHSDMLARLVEQYGSRGVVAPGRLWPETEDVIIRVMIAHAAAAEPIERAEVDESQTWRIYGSENHHLQGAVSAWHTARLASLSPTYAQRPYAGHLPREHLAAWNAYFKRYCLERARKGGFIEIASDNYNIVGLKGMYNLFDFADDAELKRRAGLLIELYCALWAQEQIDAVRGGGKCRIYQNGSDRYGAGHTHSGDLAWFYFGLGAPAKAASPLMPMLTSTWRPSVLVIDLAIDVQGRGRYATHRRPLGLAADGAFNPPGYKLRTDFGAMHRYTWCTPSYIMGTIMLEPRPWDDWVMINSQNRWHGVIFAGDPRARIVPQVRASDHRANLNQQWSVQSRGAMICQKLRTSHKAQMMRVWFSQAGLGDIVEENGWVFAEAPHAYAAVRVLGGGTHWQDPEDHPRGRWLTCEVPDAPVILQIAEQGDHAGFTAFRGAVAALPVAVRDRVATFTSLAGDVLTLPIDQDALPTINGDAVNLAPDMAFESPFVKGEWNSGLVTLTKGERTAVLNFN